MQKFTHKQLNVDTYFPLQYSSNSDLVSIAFYQAWMHGLHLLSINSPDEINSSLYQDFFVILLLLLFLMYLFIYLFIL